MTQKGRDGCNRWRSKSITFRASPQEHEIIKRMVALSGLTKQEYFLQRLMGQEARIIGNPRAFKMLKTELIQLTEELRRVGEGENPTEETLRMLE